MRENVIKPAAIFPLPDRVHLLPLLHVTALEFGNVWSVVVVSKTVHVSPYFALSRANNEYQKQSI